MPWAARKLCYSVAHAVARTLAYALGRWTSQSPTSRRGGRHMRVPHDRPHAGGMERDVRAGGRRI